MLVCRHHHRAVHEGRWHIEHHDDGLQFISPHWWPLRTLTPLITDADIDVDLDVDPQASRPDWYGDPIALGYITAVMLQPALRTTTPAFT